jgi:hypothetical protein
LAGIPFGIADLDHSIDRFSGDLEELSTRSGERLSISTKEIAVFDSTPGG